MNELPVIGFGTWIDTQSGQVIDDIKKQVTQAYSIGYRHFDTAANYGTEKPVQEALMNLIIHSSPDSQEGFTVDRSSFFVTTKYTTGKVPTPSELYRRHLVGGIPLQEIPEKDRSFAEATGVDGVVGGFQLVPDDVTQVDFGYFDLILLHHPPLTTERSRFEGQVLADWNRLVRLQQAGYAKRIGVSNFYPRQLGILVDLCDREGLPRPYLNQLELHLWCQMPNLVGQCQGYGILVEAHSPLGGQASRWLSEIPSVLEISQRIGATPAQVSLAFLIRQGIAVIPKSTRPDRMIENIDAVNFVNALTFEDIEALQAIDMEAPLLDSSQAAWTADQGLE